MSTTVVATDRHQKYYGSAVVELSSEVQLEDPMLIEQKHYGSVLEELSFSWRIQCS
jgi:hypothetical protein